MTASGTEADSSDRDWPIGPRSPDLDDSVMTARSQRRAIRSERDAVDLGLVTFERQELLAGEGVPDPDNTGYAGCRHRSAVGRVDQVEQFVVFTANGFQDREVVRLGS